MNKCPHCGNELPEAYRPLGAWEYFGYTLLFSIPVMGFIMLIVFSFNRRNLNRRSFARSYWCVYILSAIVAIAVAAIGVASGGVAELMSAFNA